MVERWNSQSYVTVWYVVKCKDAMDCWDREVDPYHLCHEVHKLSDVGPDFTVIDGWMDAMNAGWKKHDGWAYCPACYHRLFGDSK